MTTCRTQARSRRKKLKPCRDYRNPPLVDVGVESRGHLSPDERPPNRRSEVRPPASREIHFAAPQPSRSYLFRSAGTKLSHGLKGKSFDVDDAYLKKIRVAQFKARTHSRSAGNRGCVGLRRGFQRIRRARSSMFAEGRRKEQCAAKTRSTTWRRRNASSPGLAGNAPTRATLPTSATVVELPKALIGPTAVPSDAAAAAGQKRKKLRESRRRLSMPTTTMTTQPSIQKPSRPRKPRSRQRWHVLRNSGRLCNAHEAQPTASGDRSLIRTLGFEDWQNRDRSRPRRSRYRHHRAERAYGEGSGP